jgi:DNA-binding response OmpR family regulator
MSTDYQFDTQEKTNLPIFRTYNQGRVLLIEADSNMRQALKLLLNSQGYRVFVAANIAKAYSMSRFRGFTFILFNWCMEGEAGNDVCKQIRLVNKATPLFFYTRQDYEAESTSSPEANIQSYDAQSIMANAMLKAIFLHLAKNNL